MQNLKFELRYEPVSDLQQYATIPSRFEVDSVFDTHASKSGVELVERKLARLYQKDYDEFEGPTSWTSTFDTSTWALVSAFLNGERCGGAVAAFATPGVDMLEGRSDLVVLWDIRVAPKFQRKHLASELFRAVENWGQKNGCTELKVETQNTNPPACKFYKEQGCTLSEAKHGAYLELPEDVQLIWRKNLHIQAKG